MKRRRPHHTYLAIEESVLDLSTTRVEENMYNHIYMQTIIHNTLSLLFDDTTVVIVVVFLGKGNLLSLRF
jgi:hypothetical protein